MYEENEEITQEAVSGSGDTPKSLLVSEIAKETTPRADISKKGMVSSKGSFFGGLVVGVLVTCLLVIGTVVIRDAAAAKEEIRSGTVLTKGTIEKLKNLERIINTYYYDVSEEEAEPLEDGMYRGMVMALGDPYADYYSESKLEEVLNTTEGIYYGIGAYMSLDQEIGGARIAGVFVGKPAEQAGLRDNDLIVKIDGENVTGLELSEIVARVKGEEGTTVRLTIYREGEPDYLEIDVTRALIESPTVNSEMLEDNIGYIQIEEFDDVTLDQFTDAWATIKGSDARGLILDLRSNPGGNVSTVTDIARELLPEGIIVYTLDKNGKRKEYTCDGENEIQIPLVVLINDYSASASEILAGAIKDYEIGTLVGTKTFGKGIVQSVISLADGTAVKLTVSAYYTPNGNNIHGIGIEPDVVCDFDAKAYYEDGVDNQLNKAIEVIKSKIN